MTEQFQDLLLKHLGELMHQRDNCFVWNERDAILEKINAVYVLLEIDERETTTSDIIQEIVKNAKKTY